MQSSVNTRSVKWSAVLAVMALAVLLVSAVAAQDSGEFVLEQNDPKLNVDVYLGGINVYCLGSNHIVSGSIEGGGGFQVLDPQAEELLFVPEETIMSSIETMEQTGEYVTLGVSERLWYGGQPVAIHLLPHGEFQLTAMDEWEKPVTFEWTVCRNVTLSTGDGCLPGWDRNSGGACVFENLY